jgi:nitrite reductase/ring-hydroxylating ferredoxin subunit
MREVINSLEELSIEQLEMLERRISVVLMKKREEALKALRATCTHRDANGRDAFVFKGALWNGYHECSICSKLR